MPTQWNGPSRVKNSILAGLSPDDLASLAPFIQPFALRERAVIQDPRRPTEYLYFIESGLVSLRALTAGSVIETALVGCTGAVDVSVVLGMTHPIYQAVVLFPGRSLRISSTDLLQCMIDRPQIREQLLRYIPGLLLHGAQTVLCCGKHEPMQRLAAWICVASDGIAADMISITHDELSASLGLRRPTITNALNRFEEQGLIRKMRGVLEVRDRNRLEGNACACYGAITSAYRHAAPQMP